VPSTYPVGIDLGTTQSAAAFVDEEGVSQMICDTRGEILTPSVVQFKGDEIVVGRDAVRAGRLAINDVAEMAKRDMGQSRLRHAVKGRFLPPEVIQAYILRKVHRDIVAAVGEDYRVVISVPAYFDEPRRKATADAAAMSGLETLDIVNEPTAAALAFGERLGYLDVRGAPRDALTLLVYDLGGGTFDVTVIRLAPGSATTLATDGDAQLGGYDWDMALAEHLTSHFQRKYPNVSNLDRAARARLRQLAEHAKHSLSVKSQAIIRFEYAGNMVEVPVSDGEFEAMTSDLVERTAFTTRQCLRAAGVIWDDIDRLLLVGGSTRMPIIRRMLRDSSGMIPDVNVNPDEAVARGAAIYAQHTLASRGIHSVSRGLRVTDVTAHNLGIEAINPETLRKEHAVIIPRNSPLPATVSRTFHTKEDNQESVNIQLLEGESTLPSQCTPLAKAVIRNLPDGLPKGTEIDVCYSFAVNGRLEVEARLAGGGREAKIQLERLREFSNQHIAKWKQVICRDGGFDDFDDAAIEWLGNGTTDESHDAQSESNELPSDSKTPPQQAAQGGAPSAATDALDRREETRRSAKRTSRRNQFKLAIFLLGSIVSGVIGLAIGYSILRWLRPDANLPEFRLPKF
jgi:molecular chaperone DnaK